MKARLSPIYDSGFYTGLNAAARELQAAEKKIEQLRLSNSRLAWCCCCFSFSTVCLFIVAIRLWR